MIYDKTIDLHQIPIVNLEFELEKYIYNNHLEGYRLVKIITGKGRGVVRQKTLAILKKSNYVRKIEYPLWGEGDEGAIAVWLRD